MDRKFGLNFPEPRNDFEAARLPKGMLSSLFATVSLGLMADPEFGTSRGLTMGGQYLECMQRHLDIIHGLSERPDHELEVHVLGLLGVGRLAMNFNYGDYEQRDQNHPFTPEDTWSASLAREAMNDVNERLYQAWLAQQNPQDPTMQ